MTTLRIFATVLALTFSVSALDVQTLDGKTYRDCTVGLVEPDAICLIFPGGGARVKFANLPGNLRAICGYDPAKAAAFEQAQAAKRQLENARWRVARLQADARRQAAASNALARAQTATNMPVRELAAYGGRGQGGGGYGGGGYGGGGRGGWGGTGATYVGVRLVQ